MTRGATAASLLLTIPRHLLCALSLCLLILLLPACAGRDMSWNKDSGAWSLPLEASAPNKETKRETAPAF